MALDLLKRSEKGGAITATEHDTNFTNIETEVNAKITGPDAGGATIGGYRNRKLSLTGAQTLNTSTCKSGDTIIFTGAAATWTIPTRLASGDTAVTEVVAIHNRGTGAITLSASGVTIKGSTSVPADASCTLEWETASGPTHYVWARSSA